MSPKSIIEFLQPVEFSASELEVYFATFILKKRIFNRGIIFSASA